MPRCLRDVRDGIQAHVATGLVPRHPKDSKYVDSLLKLAGLLDARPFLMRKAAAALSSWVQGREPPEAAYPLSRVRLALPSHAAPLPDLPRPPDAAGGALGLEPEPSNLRVVVARHAARALPGAVSAEADFVYSLAAELFREHDQGWRVAVDTARKCWQRIATSELPQQFAEVAAADLEVEGDYLPPLVDDREALARD